LPIEVQHARRSIQIAAVRRTQAVYRLSGVMTPGRRETLSERYSRTLSGVSVPKPSPRTIGCEV